MNEPVRTDHRWFRRPVVLPGGQVNNAARFHGPLLRQGRSAGLPVKYWRRYWFAPGGLHGAAAVRIAIALSVLWTVSRLTSGAYIADPGIAPTALYRPIGVLMLLGETPPPAWLISALSSLAWISTIAMLFGWQARAATVLSWIGAVSLACYEGSFTAMWSHHNNLPFLAQLAFFGARGGDAWSVDAWWRRRRGMAPVEVPCGYQWSLRLVQFAVGLMFFSAAMAKWFFGRFTLAWVFSDNLRHQLLARFDWIGIPRTPAADWLIDEVWRYRVAAGLNLIAQVIPLVATALVNRPWLRALAGGMFVIEVAALGLVMNLWNVHWLPLVAVFVDWDRLRSLWIRRRDAAVPFATSAPSALAGPLRSRWISAFVAGFLLYDLVVSFGLDQRLRTYPFSAYPMFAYVRAKRPYDQHQSYEMPGSSIEILSDRPVDPLAQAWIDRHHTYRLLHKVRSRWQLRSGLEAATAALQQRYPELGIRGVRLYLATFQAPAYPAVARLLCHRLAILGELRDGNMTSALGTVRAEAGGITISPSWEGLEPPAAPSYLAIVDYRTEPVELSWEHRGDKVIATHPVGDSVVVLVGNDQQRYVVGEVGRRRW
jgi:hypothetical protein